MTELSDRELWDRVIRDDRAGEAGGELRLRLLQARAEISRLKALTESLADWENGPEDRTPRTQWQCRGCGGSKIAAVGVTTRQLEVYADRERSLDGDPAILIGRRRSIIGRLAHRVARAMERDGITISRIVPAPAGGQAVAEGGGS